MRNTYVIEKGVPAIKGDRDRWRLYPFNKMEVGDSFVIESEKEFKRVRNSATAYNTKNKGKAKLSTRRWENKWRCWRVE